MSDNLHPAPAKILVIDDEPGMHKILTRLLHPEFSVHTALSGEEGLEKVDAIAPDLILLDLMMPQMSGMKVLKKLTQTNRDIPIIIFTAYGSVNSAVQAIKLGAMDYIEKPFDNRKFMQTVREILKGRKTFQRLLSHRDIIGESPQIKKVWQWVEKYGPTDLPIFLQGKTGTGKELFAKAIHEISKRSQGGFVPIDCSAIPESLIESEMFGYERGAFTGANTSKPGRLDWADKGTFFLDEIANLPLLYQAKLLRVIQEQQYVPLGARKPKVIDVRFISSSNIDLMEAVRRGTFREDLYYRIGGVCIELPPLRERKGDIQLLARHFIGKYTRKYNRPTLEISDEAMELLLSYSWPGNVRELEQTIGTIVFSANRVVHPHHLPPKLRREISLSNDEGQGKIKLELSFSFDFTQPMDLKQFREKVVSEAERLIIAEAKKRFSFNQTELAKFFSIDPKTLRSKGARQNDSSSR